MGCLVNHCSLCSGGKIRNIAIIPARVGSKRLPNKNFKMFFGKPLIAWVIDEISKSGLFHKIVVSTDADKKSLQGCYLGGWMSNAGVEVYRRLKPSYKQTVDDIIYECLLHYDNQYDNICCVYATAYAVTKEHLTKGFGCYSYGMLNGDFEIDNGGFYWSKVKEFMQTKKIHLSKKYLMPMVDINTRKDFIQARHHAFSLEGGRFKCGIWL